MRTGRNQHRRASFAVFLALVVTATGCGGGDDGGDAAPAGQQSGPSAEPGSAAVTGTAVAIRNFAFVPAMLTVTRGQMITVTNEDTAPHTLTAVDGSFDSGELAKGETFTFSVDEAGTFPYFCDLHQYMKGSLQVS